MGKTITKKEFIKYMANLTAKDPKELAPLVQTFFEAIGEVLVDGNRLEIRNFGVFSVRKKNARIGCDPNNPKERIEISATAVPIFKAGKLLKQRVKEKNS